MKNWPMQNLRRLILYLTWSVLQKRNLYSTRSTNWKAVNILFRQIIIMVLSVMETAIIMRLSNLLNWLKREMNTRVSCLIIFRKYFIFRIKRMNHSGMARACLAKVACTMRKKWSNWWDKFILKKRISQERCRYWSTM